MFHKIGVAIHGYDFNIENIFNPYKEEVFEYFKSYQDSLDTIPLWENKKLNDLVSSEFSKLVQEYYIVGSPLNYINLNSYQVYINNKILNYNTYDISYPDIQALFCINPPPEGKKVMFNIPSLHNKENTIVLLQPNMIYLFPYWIPYQILNEENEEFNLTFNLKYITQNKVIHKYIGSKW